MMDEHIHTEELVTNEVECHKGNGQLTNKHTTPRRKCGKKYIRKFATTGVHPFDDIEWEKRSASIVADTGKVIFEQQNVEVPKNWSQLATNIVVSKYFKGDINAPERETSVKQLIDRVTKTITDWGLKDGYFDTQESAEAFYSDLTYLMLHQIACFNSPVWFNIGVPYAKNQSAACFINSVEDSMESILELTKTQGLLFKNGSGTGSNFSTLRGSKEHLSGGGTASGPVSFMRGYDTVAGSVKSGGKCRRSAMIQLLNVNHPDILEFIRCKAIEEQKAWVLIEQGYDGGFNVPGGAYDSVFFQNANLSVRVTDDFMTAVENDENWDLIAVNNVDKDGNKKVLETVKARSILHEIAKGTHVCGDPGIQFHDTINKWNTCLDTEEIVASNPCQPAWATVLTPDGIRTIKDVNVGDYIWSGNTWTKITKKWSTGIKQVYAFRTRAGTFYGTKAHKVVQHGVKIEADQAESIDIANCIECAHLQLYDTVDAQDVMDGLILGDGMVHKMSKNHPPLLCIGKDDHDYFNSEIKHLIVKARPGIDDHAWAVKTTILRDELPKTYNSEIPDRFKFGSILKIRGFLRGLYSANGSVVANRVTLKANSFSVIENVQQMLSALGMRSYYTINKPKPCKFKNDTYQCRESYDLNISTDRDRFAELIGFIQKYKQNRFTTTCKTTPARTKTTYEITSREFVSTEEVFDLTVEDSEHTYWTGGLLVSNCAEFVFLNDTACNLASLNLLKFKKGTEKFDVEKFKNAIKTMITAMDILVSRSSYPTEQITQNSHNYRPLGLGYANLGALLMSEGLPYDSDKGRALAASITAIMHGTAYKTSTELAQSLGKFKYFDANKSSCLRILKQHYDAACALNTFAPQYLRDEAAHANKTALDRAKIYGIRNAQVTVLAPVGTIGFMMDCDTTGVEPDIALVKHKKLSGGGTLAIVNKTIPTALRRLGYADNEITAVEKYVLDNSMIEGAPYIKTKHLPVFDCALKPAHGTRAINYMGHIKMLAAVQPFLSGSISKTVNVPKSITVKEIENIYIKAWKQGVKCVAVYRDGSKKTQPMITMKDKQPEDMSRPMPTRYRLPTNRPAITHKFSITGHEGYLTVGMYEDGKPGEIFIRMAKEGSTISGLMDAFATSVSIMFQYGIPLAAMVDKFSFAHYEPSGITANPQIPIAKSLTDYVFRWLAITFGSDLNNIPEIPIPSDKNNTTTTNGARNVCEVVSDAPPCTSCGNIMVRNGSCYKCNVCGSTSGCS